MLKGFCVLAPNPIRAFQPPIFAFVRVSLITIVLFFLSIFVDRNYSFRSERALSRYNNPIIRYIKKKTPTFKMFKSLFICGSMNTINMIFFVIGLNMTNATVAGLLQPFIAGMLLTTNIFISIMLILSIVYCYHEYNIFFAMLQLVSWFHR